MVTCKDCQFYGVCILNRRSADADVTGCKVYEVKRDLVEVVRCKDCKYYYKSTIGLPDDCLLHCIDVNPDDFCSYGERGAPM